MDNLNQQKTVFILRGLSGSGKSSYARRMERCFTIESESRVNTIIVSADHLFETPGGEYAFDASRLGEAHAQCMARFLRAIRMGVQRIIVDNTNVRRWEYDNYVEIAGMLGYVVRIIEFSCDDLATARRFMARSSHSMAEITYCDMLLRWEHDSRTTYAFKPTDESDTDF